jgi:curli biogenesis system outer membrane secretion channel CsgG
MVKAVCSRAGSHQEWGRHWLRVRAVRIASLRRLVLCLLLLATTAAAAHAAETEVTVDGYGITPQEAVANALAEAVKQVNGSTVDARQFMKSSATQVVQDDGKEQTQDLQLSAQLAEEIDVRGSGLVGGYDVLSNRPSERGFTANVSVRVLRYDAPGVKSADRRRLAVIPRASLRPRYNVHSQVSGDELTDRYVSALEAALVQSRRFAVLDRAESATLDEERARWRSSDAPLQEQVKLGQSLGVDYLMFTRVLDAKAGVTTQHVQLTDEYIRHSYADIKVEIRVLLAATGEVKFADTVSMGLGELGTSDTQAMLNKTASRVSSLVTERIYPMQIISRQADEFVLNQGGGSVKSGDRFRVVQHGAALTDPYTNEPLGFAETEVATIQVSRVEDRVSYARVVDGSSAAVQAGMTVRRSAKAAAARPRAQPQQPAAGVKLPFDR